MVDVSIMEKNQNERIDKSLEIFKKLISQLDITSHGQYIWTFDRSFINSKYKLITLLSLCFDKVTPEIISVLLKNFVNQCLDIKEILNYFFTINQLICHFDFYAIPGTDLSRRYELGLIKKYYEKMPVEFSYCIENYKTEPGDDFMNYNGNEERRRKVYMDDSCKLVLTLGMFNYICAKCIEKCGNPLCTFSHSENEIFFHPLVFKTRMCQDYLYGMCSKVLCPLSHDYITDFRIIYSKDDQNIINVLEDAKTLYTSVIYNLDKNGLLLPLEFNLKTYKVNPCPLGQYCRLDRPLCLNYHDVSERRRCPFKFKYGPLSCNKVFIDGRWGVPSNCPEVLYILTL
jgi:hypothetical protein